MFASPEENILHLSFRPNMKVADFGAGSGAYTLALAKKIGPENGRVFALEVQKEMLERLKIEAENKNVSNIETIWADVEQANGQHLVDDSMDAAVVSNVLFQAESKTGLATEVKRILKPGGQVLLIDWSESFGGLGPEPSAVVSKDGAITLFTNLGFTVREEFDAGEHHYGLVLLKQ